MSAMHASTLCRRELALLEGTVLRWYRDATGTWTCCTGHTAAAGPPVYAAGQTFTAAQSDAICAADLARVYEPAMGRLIKVPLTQYEWDGVELLTYNIGEGNLADALLSVETALDDIPALAISKADAARLQRGQAVLLRGRDAPILSGVIYVTASGQLIALAEVDRGEIVPKRVFNLVGITGSAGR